MCVCVCCLHRIGKTFLIWWFCFATFGRFGISLRKHRRQQVFAVVPVYAPYIEWESHLGHCRIYVFYYIYILSFRCCALPFSPPRFVKRLVWPEICTLENCQSRRDFSPCGCRPITRTSLWRRPSSSFEFHLKWDHHIDYTTICADCVCVCCVCGCRSLPFCRGAFPTLNEPISFRHIPQATSFTARRHLMRIDAPLVG